MPVREAFILCGGLGTRLGSLTDNTPKPLLEVNGKPFVEHLIFSLCRTGINKVYLLAGYLGKQFEEQYHGKTIGNISIEVITENTPLGTGGAINSTLHLANDTFFLLNGDSWCSQNLLELEKYHASLRNKNVDVECVILGIEKDDVGRFGSLSLDSNNRVISFDEKKSYARGIINAGVYLFSKSAFSNYHKETKFSLESKILTRLVRRNSIYAFCNNRNNEFIDMGIPEDFSKATNYIMASQVKPAVFWDRDNTLNIDNGYTHKITDLRWIEGAKDSIKYMAELGFRNFVISNQAGVARGYYKALDVIKFHREMQDQLISEGAFMDFFAFCPHHPKGKVAEYAFQCECRKPSPGLIASLSHKFPTDLSKSFVVGDKPKDIKAAMQIGIGHLKVDPMGNLLEQMSQYMRSKI